MNTDVIDDLKQFIVAATLQQTADIRQDLAGVKDDIIRLDTKIDVVKSSLSRKIDLVDERLSAKIDAIDRRFTGKIDDLAAAVGEALEHNNTNTDEQLANHETRISKLEHNTV